MAISVLTNATVIVNGVTLSSRATKVTVTDTRDSVDVTTMGATNKAVAKGLGDAKINVDFLQDFGAGMIHATLQPLVGSTTPVAVEVRADSAARSATNPAAYLAGALLMNYSMLDGAVGAASSISAEFINASTAGMTYPTS
jgi:hypothetical protein